MSEINLSEGEWKIMKLLWESSPRTIASLVESLHDDTGWDKHTLFVMLKRLIAKGAVSMEEGERAHLYYPVIARSDAVHQETKSFLSRVFDGSVEMLISSLAGQRTISDEKISSLRAILQEAEEERKKASKDK